jgi:hypothetical protein
VIKFSLVCDRSHSFESWFANGAAYDEQAPRGRVECPVCGSSQVTKAIMAPAVASHRGKAIEGRVIEGKVIAPVPAKQVPAPLLDARQREIRAALGAMRTEIIANTVDVGSRFPEEARKIHDGESQDRPIRGEATVEEVHALIEEGVKIMPIPGAPEDMN